MAVDSRVRSLTSQSLLLIVGRLTGFVFAFGIPVALTRLLDQGSFGGYKQFFLVAGLLVGILPLGLDASLYFFIPQHRERAGHYLAQAAATAVGIGTATGGLLWLFKDTVAGWLNSPLLAAVMPWLVIYLLCETVGQMVERTVVIEGQVQLAALVFAGSDAVRAAALVVPALLTRSVFWVAVGAAVYGLARLAAGAGWVLWQYRDRFAAGWRAVQFRDQCAYGMPFGGGAAVENLLQRFHGLYVAGTYPAAAFATYAVGTQQIAPVQIFFRSLFEVTLVRMSEHFAAGRQGEMRQLWSRLIAKQAAAVVPLVMVLWLLADAFIEGVFTRAYVGAVPVFRISLALVPLTMLNDHCVLRACGRTKFILVANLAALGATLVAVPMLTGVLGMRGAALGWVVGLATMKLVGLLKVRELLGLRIRQVLPWSDLLKYALGGAVAVALVFPTTRVIDEPLIRFFACGALFWTAYIVVAWGGDLFSRDDKRVIGDVLRSVRLGVAGLVR